ncbi:serine hydrolase [Bradyrhizobium sp. CCBAU 51753]|uniref:serine hydrolase domain-containing protein n=1 Tax=Bradyrhizobium sp. CCBAU 51753 TaxID=1325100 RepID=UPI00188D5402|nr:serine hydrolase [Bradyrhizobium sp. CCBAU 51753]QOZ23802.1 6-aminohexanoate hydrolase [Bradyrhizobium sp. CCBAU 51753]
MTEDGRHACAGNEEKLSNGMLEFDREQYLDGRASDPGRLCWMQGAPPPADKSITFESDAFLQFPKIRWSLSHMRELAATLNVWRGPGEPSHLERHDRTVEIDALTFIDMMERPRRFDEALIDTYTDGILVLHRGRIVYERYFGALASHLPHACNSVTKSYAGTLTATLVAEGVLDDSKTIPHYLPELRGTAWDDATLRQVMDMQTGLLYTELYAEPTSDVWDYARAAGWRPRNERSSKTSADYLRSIKKAGIHGETFSYKSVNTEVMAWVAARVTGRSFVQLLSELLWAPLGCEQDGYVIVDSVGMPMAGAGLSATLRDLARFGELMRREGQWNGKQLIPACVVHDLQKDAPLKFPLMGLNYSYRSQWWVTHNELDAIEARGIHGQRLYIAPKAEMVIARFASHPMASAAFSDPITMPQMFALGQMLSR